MAPQNLENDLKTEPLISQVMVHGDKRKFLSALVTLNEENARKWASENGVPAGAALHENPRVRAQHPEGDRRAQREAVELLDDQAVRHRAAGTSRRSSGELTPTLKVKRKVVTQNYKDLLDSFYAE